MLLAATGRTRVKSAAFFVAALGKYSNAFALVALRLGLLLCSNKMDTESAASMW
jgi:hypothetical protein